MEINHSLLKENSEIRRLARERLKGNWGIALLLCLIYSIVCGLSGCIPYIGAVIGLLISGPMVLGLVMCFVGFVRNEQLKFETLFDGFKNFSSALVLQLLIGIFSFLWSLLFIVPGIIAAFRYSMAFYILNDNPQMGAKAALEESKKMMKGNKGKLFCLEFSFIGWALLCILTLGMRIPAYPDGDSGGIRTVNRKHPDTLSMI
ncbi:MAG: DUF975 family protein [Clostridiaceae bacterium]